MKKNLAFCLLNLALFFGIQTSLHAQKDGDFTIRPRSGHVELVPDGKLDVPNAADLSPADLKAALEGGCIVLLGSSRQIPDVLHRVVGPQLHRHGHRDSLRVPGDRHLWLAVHRLHHVLWPGCRRALPLRGLPGQHLHHPEWRPHLRPRRLHHPVSVAPAGEASASPALSAGLLSAVGSHLSWPQNTVLWKAPFLDRRQNERLRVVSAGGGEGEESGRAGVPPGGSRGRRVVGARARPASRIPRMPRSSSASSSPSGSSCSASPGRTTTAISRSSAASASRSTTRSAPTRAACASTPRSTWASSSSSPSSRSSRTR